MQRPVGWVTVYTEANEDQNEPPMLALAEGLSKMFKTDVLGLLLLVKVLFRGADVADARQQLVKIGAATMFQPLIIQRKAFNDKLTEPLRRPDAELRATK
jgi:hypothetical protein